MKNVMDLISSGLWSENKTVIGELALLELGYHMFYEGKNADMYFRPGTTSVLMVRTDRCSVFDIPLSDTIDGKGKIQNQISNFGYDFAEKMGINTARLPMPDDIPIDIAEKSQHIQLAPAMSMMFENGKETGLELIYRNFLTGSLYKAYKKGEDPYELNLPSGMEEWGKFENPVFTPTTKGVSDEPIPHQYVIVDHRDDVVMLNNLFEAFSIHALKKGIVLVDTKFEMFGGMLGDEILTPESSRYILKYNFDQGIYDSMDKQILRDYAKQQGWDKKGVEGQLLYVTIPDEVKEKVLAGYQMVYNMLAN